MPFSWYSPTNVCQQPLLSLLSINECDTSPIVNIRTVGLCDLLRFIVISVCDGYCSMAHPRRAFAEWTAMELYNHVELVITMAKRVLEAANAEVYTPPPPNTPKECPLRYMRRKGQRVHALFYGRPLKA